MTFFQDLSTYTYHGSHFYRPHTRNIGWLQLGRDFPKAQPVGETLDLLWEYCRVSVAQMRGIHQCEFCDSPPRTVYATRNGLRLLLGTSEIRVTFEEHDIYAAPTLIYHYVRTHHYSPPDEFLRALQRGPRPPGCEYFEKLNSLGLEWNRTSPGDRPGKGFRFEKIDGKIARIEVDTPVFWDEA